MSSSTRANPPLATQLPEELIPPVSMSASIPATKSRPSPIRWLLWSFIFVLVMASSATLGAVLALLAPVSPGILPEREETVASAESTQTSLLGGLLYNGFRYRLTRPVNILVMGIDRVPSSTLNSPEAFAGRSDTMLLLRFDPEDRSLRMLSIPRDTRVSIPEFGLAKVNQANVEGGPAMAARVVSRNLNNVAVDRYLRVTTDAFRDIVDLVGGVEVFVPKRMVYTDRSQGLEIELEQGWQTLDGDRAEQFARFRNDGQGDIGRVQRQQILLKALRQRLTSPKILPKLPKLVQMMRRYVDTNLSIDEMLALAGFGMSLDSEDVKMVMLPGRFSTPNEFVASYWIMDPAAKDRVMSDFFDVSSARLAYRDSVQYASQSRELNNVRIAVQNASGQPGMSAEVVRYLAKKGLRNVYTIEDWPDNLRTTQVIAQSGDTSSAQEVRRFLGIGEVEAASVGALNSDLTIRVGADWLTHFH